VNPKLQSVSRVIWLTKEYDFHLPFSSYRPEIGFLNLTLVALVVFAAFTHAYPKSAKNTFKLSVFLRFWDLHT